MKTLKEQGFTIVELMIVLLVIVISIVIAAPNFAGIIRKNNVVAATNELTGLMQYAKSLAVATNAPTIVCPLKAYDVNTGKAECVSSKENFNAATKIGAFKYGTKGVTELVRVINLPKSVTVKDINDKAKAQSIAFYPDSSAGIHGMGTTMAYYNDDGSYGGSSLDLNSLTFPPVVTDTVKWQIKSNIAKADSKCYVVSISRLGKTTVKEDNCQ